MTVKGTEPTVTLVAKAGFPFQGREFAKGQEVELDRETALAWLARLPDRFAPKGSEPAPKTKKAKA